MRSTQSTIGSGRSMTKVVGIDVSLTSTGLASDGWTRKVVSIGLKSDSLLARRDRITEITDQIFGWRLPDKNLRITDPGLVVIEQPAYSRVGGHNHDRSGLWWRLVDILIDGHTVVEVAPTTMKKYITGKGNAGKDDVIRCISQLFPWFAGGNDEADALALAAMGYDHLGKPLVDLPAKNREALKGVRWDA